MSNTFIPDKPFKTYEEMLDLLESRNVLISNRAQAIEILSTISYYTLINGYKHLFDYDENDVFCTPVDFNDFRYLQLFDFTMNNILFKYIIFVENALKSHMSYIISKRYGVWTDLNVSDPVRAADSDYLSKKHYISNRSTNNRLKDIKETAISSNIPSMVHYKEEHNHIPCWILIKSIPLGLTIAWLNLMVNQDKAYVCNQMVNSSLLSEEEKKEFTRKGLELLRKYRNNIAHGNVVFANRISIQLPKKQVLLLSNGVLTASDYNKGLGKSDILATVIAVSSFLNNPDKVIFIDEVSRVFEQFKDLIFSNGKSIFELLNLPTDLLSRLKRLQQERS